ncbi:acyltransferase [Couchioplanes caeruleus]|uniref:acyltransferase family protein n=1 Tax=Couchioplanes caeruleus TaxID=56438 RepID=UPI0020C11FBC|nr:acyltransferase [Couchioplanes caeruleus]UQU63868.1 acyltransferase [Couchioplanes caeruleus]
MADGALRVAEPSLSVTASARLDSLTGLRGLTSTWIYVFHFFTFRFVLESGKLTFVQLDRPRFLTMAGNMALSSFFVLSGFVLTLTTREGTSLANFCAKRVGKLYPIYFVTSALAIIAILLIGMPISTENIVLHLGMLQSWVPYQEIYHGVNPVTWSLSTEAFFYVLFPLSLFLLRRLSTRALGIMLVVAVFLEFALPWYVMRYFTVNPDGAGSAFLSSGGTGGDLVYWFTLAAPPYRFLEFVVGMICCLLLRRGALPFVRQRWAWLFVAVGYLIGTYAPGYWQRTAVGLVPLAVLLVSLAQADLAEHASFLRHRFFVRLGDLSFGLYAIQLLVLLPSYPFLLRWLSSTLDVPERTLEHLPWNVAFVLAYFGVIVLLAMPLHRYVEVPAYNVARRFFRDRPGSAMFTESDVPARTGP